MPLTIDTTRFGPLEIAGEAVIEFPAGLIGLMLKDPGLAAIVCLVNSPLFISVPEMAERARVNSV